MGYAHPGFVIVFASLAVICSAQSVRRFELAQLFNFEGQQSAGMPRGWGGGPRETIFADDKVVHGGKWAAHLERDSASAGKFSTITISIPIDSPVPAWNCAAS
jgi:hypothetical protein